MIDSNYNVWLIEVNTNPCLETACPVLNKIIPKFVENAFQYFYFDLESVLTLSSQLPSASLPNTTPTSKISKKRINSN